jgi:hypothetical protein
MAQLSATTYSLWLSTPTNIRLLNITNFHSLNYTRSVNVPGAMNFTIASKLIDRILIKRDARLEIWRSIGGTEYLETNTQWFIRRWRIDKDNEIITVQAQSALSLAARRIIAYASGSSQATKNAVADSMIVEFAKENMGSDVTDSDRDWSDKIDFIAAAGVGPSVHKSASRRILLNTLQDIAQDAGQSGTPVFFDMEYNTGSEKLEFKTFVNQRGLDLTAGQQQLTLSPDFGNLENSERIDDYMDEVTFVYAAGQGVGEARNVQTASDTVRINESPFGRVEQLRDARMSSTDDKLLAEAQTALRAGRPKRVLEGTIVNKEGSIYGLNWKWGDKIKVDFEGEVQTARADTVRVSVRDGKETIKADLRVED